MRLHCVQRANGDVDCEVEWVGKCCLHYGCGHSAKMIKVTSISWRSGLILEIGGTGFIQLLL